MAKWLRWKTPGGEVVVVDSAECVDLMESFIADEPTLWFEDIGEVDDIGKASE